MLAAYYRAKDNVKGIIGQLWSDNWINEIEANNEGNTSLLLAAWFGRKYAVGQLYLETSKQMSMNVNVANNVGNTSLLLLTNSGHTDIIVLGPELIIVQCGYG